MFAHQNSVRNTLAPIQSRASGLSLSGHIQHLPSASLEWGSKQQFILPAIILTWVKRFFFLPFPSLLHSSSYLLPHFSLSFCFCNLQLYAEKCQRHILLHLIQQFQKRVSFSYPFTNTKLVMVQKHDVLHFCTLVFQYPSENAQQIQKSFTTIGKVVEAPKIIMFL